MFSSCGWAHPNCISQFISEINTNSLFFSDRIISNSQFCQISCLLHIFFFFRFFFYTKNDLTILVDGLLTRAQCFLNNFSCLSIFLLLFYTYKHRLTQTRCVCMLINRIPMENAFPLFPICLNCHRIGKAYELLLTVTELHILTFHKNIFTVDIVNCDEKIRIFR